MTKSKVSKAKVNENDSTINHDDCLFAIANRNSDSPIRARYKGRKRVHRVFTEPSLTVPDQSYTLRELYERSVVNSMPAVVRAAYYDEEQNVDRLFAKSGIDINTLDLVEIQEYKDQLDERIRNMKGKLQQQNKPAAQAVASESE